MHRSFCSIKHHLNFKKTCQLSLQKRIYQIVDAFWFVEKPYCLISIISVSSHGSLWQGWQGWQASSRRPSGSRCTLREIWATSGSTLEFADWVMSIQDQVDLANETPNMGRQQYYDTMTGQVWYSGYGPMTSTAMPMQSYPAPTPITPATAPTATAPATTPMMPAQH